MSTLTIYDLAGKPAGEMDLADGLLTMVKGRQAVHDVVVAHMAARRAGTAATLRKGEVAGSNKKPWKQKGTGRARAGLKQSPVWRGGGVVFGPQPRDYSKKVNRKVSRLAFRRAFGEKVAAGQVKVIEALVLETPKTRQMAAVVKALGIAAPVLFVVDAVHPRTALAVRNLPGVAVVRGCDVSVYQLLRYPTLVVSRPGMDQITARLAAGTEGAA
jgi:large subunit ribosomal protein L4